MLTSDILFVSAQPDEPYFIWQSQVYLHNFLAHGLKPQQCVAIFSTQPHTDPSPQLRELQSNFPQVDIQMYPDTRDQAGKAYPPSIQPHVFTKAYQKYPDWKDRVIFFHDCDIAFRRLPDFELMLQTQPGCCLLSDTVGYLGYSYLQRRCQKLSQDNPAIPPDHLLQGMCEIVGIDPEIVKENEQCSGGAQYLLRDVDEHYWQKVYQDSINIKFMFDSYGLRYKLNAPIQEYIQVWTAGMWAYVWNLWLRGHKTVTHTEMDFVFAGASSATASSATSAPIIHMTGLRKDQKNTHFNKLAWIKVNPIQTLRAQPFLFDHIPKNAVSFEYVSNIYDIVGIQQPRKHALMPALHWRVLAWPTDGQSAWDIERLVFLCRNTELHGTPIESKNAGLGYEAVNAWNADTTKVWGGRTHQAGQAAPHFFLGISCREPCLPEKVTITQAEQAQYAALVLLQYSHNGVDWYTAQVTKLNPDNTEQTIFYRSDHCHHAQQWRIRTTQTASGWAWDVHRLAFLLNSQEQTGTPFSSGYADNKGYAPIHAFEDTGTSWGGRPDDQGQFYLGIKSAEVIAINHITLEQQSPSHRATTIDVQCSDDGQNWRTIKTITRLKSGINSIYLFGMEASGKLSEAAEAATAQTSSIVESPSPEGHQEGWIAPTVLTVNLPSSARAKTLLTPPKSRVTRTRTSHQRSAPFPVDAVVTWVRMDAERRESMRRHLGQEDVRVRVRQFSDELDTAAYVVGSIRRFAPWVGKIFIVTSGQVPRFMEGGGPAGVEILTEEQIFPQPLEEYLPTFNSCAIEMNLHRIPGLAERFLYFNDDMFLCRPTSIWDFYDPEGHAVFATTKTHAPTLRKLQSFKGRRNVLGGIHYLFQIAHMRDLVQQTLGMEPSVPWHGVNAYRKDYFQAAEHLFPTEFASTRKCRTRYADVEGRTLNHFFPLLVAQAQGVVKTVRHQPMLYMTKIPPTLDAFQKRLSSNSGNVLCMQNCMRTYDSTISSRRILDWLMHSAHK